MTPGHDSLAPLADDYVLGALSDTDARLFSEHLGTCPECQRAVAELTMAGEALARSLEPIPPPPGLRDRVIAHATRRAPVAAKQRALRWDLLAAAAVLIAAIMTAATFYYRNEAVRARSEQAAAAGLVRTLEQQIATLQASAATSSQTTTVLTANDLTRVDLAGQTAAPGAMGRVFWSPTHGLVFAATNLPALPPGRVYQLWVVAAQPISAGIAQPSATGFSVVNPAGVNATPKAFALTIEPEGGRPAPTGPMFLLGSM